MKNLAVGIDTGFYCYHKGWQKLRDDFRGVGEICRKFGGYGRNEDGRIERHQ